MKVSKMTKQQRFTPIVIGLLGTWLGMATAQADGLATDYDSYPPLISTAGAGDKPNILIMLDTSGSMMQNATGTWVGSEHETSRHVIARKAINEIIEKYSAVANVGLMAFQPPPSLKYKSQTGGCYGGSLTTKEWCGEGTGSSPNYLVRRGHLYIPIGSIDPADTSASTVSRRNEFRRRLGLDVLTNTIPLSGYYDLFKTETEYYVNSVDYTTNRRLVSDGGTPLEGTYLSAHEYFKGTLSSSYRDAGISAADAAWPTNLNQCGGNDFAILITDGMPTVTPTGYAHNTCATDKNCSNRSEFTTDLYNQIKAMAADVPSYVVGFAVGNNAEEKALLDNMAVAGKSGDKGADTAFVANDLTALSSALDGIFAQIISRTSSGTGAAVVANRGNGLSADFQALYTPELTLNGKTVNWVGTLQSFFVDENRQFREDTNKNGLLDAYNVDRVLDFEYDESLGKTVVTRTLSSSATAPTPVANTITGDVDEIASIWSARDQLAVVTDVLTQRPYQNVANTGRHILTSVDGKTLINFGVIDPVSLEALDQTEDTLRSTIASLDGQIEATIIDLGNRIVDANTYATESTGTLVTAAQALSAAIASVAAQSSVDVTATSAALATAQSAQQTASTALGIANGELATATQNDTDADTAVTNTNTALGIAQGTLTTALATQTTEIGEQATAQSNFNTAQGALDDAQDVVDQEILDVQAATGPRDTAQTNWNTANTNLSTANSNLTTANATLAQETLEQQSAQAAYDAELTPQGDCVSSACLAAQTALNAANAELAGATTAQASAQSAFNSAQTAFNTADSALTAASSALATQQGELTAAEGIRDAAVQPRDDAQAALTLANNELAAANQAVTAATEARDLAQGNYDAAVTAAGLTQGILDQEIIEQAAAQTAYNTADAATTAAQTAFDNATAASNYVNAMNTWVGSVNAAITSLRDALALAAGISSADSTDRENALTALSNAYSALWTLLNNVPSAGANPDVLAIVAAITAALGDIATDGTMLAELAQLTNSLNNGTAGVDSLIESAAYLDERKTLREDAQTALVTNEAQISTIAHIKYMDDSIIGQANDVDLTYTERNEIVKWVRGQENSNLRSRTIDFDNDGVDEVWRLPDIVHSTPAIVGRPTEAFYSDYGDDTYRTYLEAKFNRRQVIYTGSNGGLLHAFNGGFWDDAQKGYVTRLASDTTSVQHPLGAELWAYVPKAALPHLQFVADPDYTHMALVDGAPQTFDVNIFTPSATHPQGWGTILVVNMRLGGGAFTVRVDEDDDGTDEDVVVRPSVMIFDVTDPEVPPTLIAELSHPEIGFTFGRPALIKYRQRGTGTSFVNPAENRWLLVFGSGPTDLNTATSNQEARMFAYDLNEQEWATEWTNNPNVITLESNAFFGDAVSEDWDGDYIDDVVYFGLNTGNAATTDGRMARLRLRGDQGESGWISNASLGTLIDVDRSIIGRPATKSDQYGRRWVLFGTGRMLVDGDNMSTQQQYLIGVMEPIGSDLELNFGTVSSSNLQDVSDIDVKLTGEVENGPTGVTKVPQLATYINQNKDGWRLELQTNGTNPSGRSTTRPAQSLQSVFFTEYVPSGDQCEPEGEAFMYDLNVMTGTVYPENYLTTYTYNGHEYISNYLEMGQGMIGDLEMVGESILSHGSGGNAELTTPLVASGALRRQSWRQIFDFGF